ncbi:M23 family metallopeptidase [Lentzea tibetensis]|nr:M23 family metallopeptidase [Lentzea tibetensis]
MRTLTMIAAAAMSLSLLSAPAEAAPASPFSLPYQPGTTHLVTQGFGGSSHNSGPYTWHGVDFAMASGTPVLTTMPGTVHSSTLSQGWGHTIVIKHYGDVCSRYAHLSRRVHPPVGGQVGRGALIGYSGNTGNSTGPHLHFQIQKCSDNRTIYWNGFKEYPGLRADDNYIRGRRLTSQNRP